MIRSVILSKFDVVEGPRIIYMVPKIKEADLGYVDFVPRLIDFIGKKDSCFMNSMGDIFSLNYYFEMECSTIRGNKNLILVSVVIQTASPSERKKVPSFLSTQEIVLEKLVKSIKKDPDYIRAGLFHEENTVKLKDDLHQFYQQFFVESNFFSQLDNDRGKICVIGPRLYNPQEEIEFFKSQINATKNGLKDRLIIKTINEFEYINFYCQDRDQNLETCKKDECPVCRTYAIESDASIYIYNNSYFDFDTDIQDLVDFASNICSVSNLPLLIIEIDELKVDDHERVALVESIKKAINHLQENKCTLNSIKFVITQTDDPSGFIDGISWLVKELF
ncbi:MAG: hypothetical protein ACTSUE_06000 [Promethearchaeota archaeon]